MPIYEYACKKCGREFEELIRGDEKPVCPNCGDADVQRQMSVLAAHMAGSDGACPSRDACQMSHCCSGSCSHGH